MQVFHLLAVLVALSLLWTHWRRIVKLACVAYHFSVFLCVKLLSHICTVWWVGAMSCCDVALFCSAAIKRRLQRSFIRSDCGCRRLSPMPRHICSLCWANGCHSHKLFSVDSVVTFLMRLLVNCRLSDHLTLTRSPRDIYICTVIHITLRESSSVQMVTYLMFVMIGGVACSIAVYTIVYHCASVAFLTCCSLTASLLWCCWFGSRKHVQLVNNPAVEQSCLGSFITWRNSCYVSM